MKPNDFAHGEMQKLNAYRLMEYIENMNDEYIVKYYSFARNDDLQNFSYCKHPKKVALLHSIKVFIR